MFSSRDRKFEILGERFLQQQQKDDISAAAATARKLVKLADRSKENQKIAMAYTWLGAMQSANANFTGAEASWQRAKQFSHSFESSDGLLGMILGNLATISVNTGKYEAALEYTKQALDLSTRIYGLSSFETMNALHNHANSLIALTRHNEARSFQVNALEIARGLPLVSLYSWRPTRSAAVVEISNVLLGLMSIYHHTKNMSELEKLVIEYRNWKLDTDWPIQSNLTVSAYEALIQSYSGDLDGGLHLAQKVLLDYAESDLRSDHAIREILKPILDPTMQDMLSPEDDVH